MPPECPLRRGAGSRPRPVAYPASLAAAHSRFFARSRPSGAAAVTTARAEPAARGDTDDGRQRAIYPAAPGPGAGAGRRTAFTLCTYRKT